MTTNGMRLAALAQPLADAGLRRINISLDALNARTFQHMTHRGDFERVWAGVLAAERAGLTPIKLNAVIDGMGTVGFISSVSQPFCAQCNRARLTADGILRLCLLQNGEAQATRNKKTPERILPAFPLEQCSSHVQLGSTDCSQSEPFAAEVLPQFLHSIAYPQREQRLSCLT